MPPRKNSVARKPAGKRRISRKSTLTAINVGTTPAEVEPIVVAVAQEIIAPPLSLPDVQETVTATVSIATVEESIYNHPGRLLIVALFLGWLVDFLFWKQGIGVNFAIFWSLCILGGLAWLLSNGLRPARSSLWLLLPFVSFAVVTFLRQEPLTTFLAFTFTLLAAGLFASSYESGRWPLYGLTDYFYKFFLLVGDILTGLVTYIPKARKVQKSLASDKKAFPIWALMRGLLIALPIVAFFATLLAAGDVVFKQKLDDFLDTEDLSENTLRGILILLYAYVLAGVLIHAALKSKDVNLIGENKPFLKTFLGFTESAIILASVSALFLAFVIVQFQYFFGGEKNIGVEGYTYSQYARRGFNELVIVAFFSLVLILGLSTVTRRENESQRKVYSWLSVALVALVLIILLSAYQRISLAIGWHGYSRLRLYPRIFLIWLALLLITVVILEILRRERYFAFAAVLASVGFAVSITLFNIDAAIVKYNVFRAVDGHNLNVAHLASLSMDAVPALADEYLAKELPPLVHDGVGAMLSCYRYNEPRPHIKENDWRSFNYSKWQAHQALEEVRPLLAGYVIRYDKWPVKVHTPGGYLYDCKYYGSAEEE